MIPKLIKTNCLITKGCSIFFLSLYHNKENIIKYSVIHNHLSMNVFHHQLKPLATVIPVFLVKKKLNNLNLNDYRYYL